jgi:hypothetical protein
MDTRSHEQLDAQIGAMTQGELTFTADLQFCLQPALYSSNQANPAKRPACLVPCG